MTTRMFLLAMMVLGLSGCERLTELANQAKLNGRAIGAACRHSGRALEDCFQRNVRVSKADIFAGWKEMNEYMTKNKLDVITPPPDQPPKGPVTSVEIGGGTEPADEAASETSSTPVTEKPAAATSAAGA